jgi:malate dehydrogenase (oxaloacetate-decarboxylating)(NADP+)
MAKISKQEALDYHSSGRKGKIEVIPSKPYSSQRDLSLAYSPGVAEPCKQIAEDKSKVYNYTAKGNLVAVISNGTAVLGLGDIGPEASKPVMEGKGLLFKIFADIDVFDIEVDAKDVDTFVNTVKAIAPTFGGINLEDIKAPEAFEIERRLKEELDIPVMHDDQHGTAIISGAALLNALELAEKKIEDVTVVVNGAGAAAVSCARLYFNLGVQPKNLIMLDSKGVLNHKRENLTPEKLEFVREVEAETLADALVNADVFLGLSVGNIVNKEMLKAMAENPIVFALANPEPEIAYKEALSARKDVIMATGRSDHPNQVNNVLGFPYIFRGAIDVRAKSINEEMKLAAVKAIAELARETVPEEVVEAYGAQTLSFGKEYIIPKPLDYRLLVRVSVAVAKAAIESGVAQNPIANWDAYEEQLRKRIGRDNQLMRGVIKRAQAEPKRVVFAEADNHRVLKAAALARDEGIALPILLGRKSKIEELAESYVIDLEGMEIRDPKSDEEEAARDKFGALLFEKRKRKGVNLFEACKLMRERNYFAAMLVETGEADAALSGITRNYKDVIKPALTTIGMAEGVSKVAGMYIAITKEGPLFLADTTVNVNPTAEELAEITAMTASAVKRFKITPRIALLSYSNFGSSKGEDPEKAAKAVAILHQKHPSLIVDGDIQANFALNNELMEEMFPFSDLVNKKVNTLIFPNLISGNIAYKLLQEVAKVEVVGPILMGMKKPFHVLQLGSSVREILNMITIAVADAQQKRNKKA